jgi:hypothetical protein
MVTFSSVDSRQQWLHMPSIYSEASAIASALAKVERHRAGPVSIIALYAALGENT